MHSSLISIPAKQEAQLHRERIEDLILQMQHQGAIEPMLEDYVYHHKRLMHLQDHYDV